MLSLYVLLVEVTVRAGPYRLRAPASLKLSEIVAFTAGEIWEDLDRQVDEQISYFENRHRGNWVQ